MVTFRLINLRMGKILGKSFRENQNTYFMFYIFFFQKPFRVWDNVGKIGTAGQATDDNIMRRKKMRYACRVIKAKIQTYTHNT